MMQSVWISALSETGAKKSNECVDISFDLSCNVDCESTNVIHLSALETYIMTISTTRKFTCLSVPNWYAIADCSTEGSIGSSFVILKQTGNARYVCSCQSKTGEGGMCIHMEAARHIWGNECQHADQQDHHYAQEPVLPAVDKLSSGMYACFDGATYGLFSKHRNNQIRCHSCSSVIQSCPHIQCFHDWSDVNELPESEDLSNEPCSESPSDGYCLSFSTITYPPGPELRERYTTMIATGGARVDGDLTPDKRSVLQCKHGHAWSDLDPAEMGWTMCSQPNIYYLQWTDNSKRNGKLLEKWVFRNYLTVVIAFLVLYCRTSGDCDCKLEYDGQVDLLLNLDGKHLIHYGLLYHYLHLMMEGRNPLAAFIRYCYPVCCVSERIYCACRSLKRDFDVLRGANALTPPYHVIRKVWLAFVYKLTESFDLQSEFSCDICGPIISLDCMTLGCRRDLMMMPKEKRSQELSSPALQGSSYRDRVCIVSKYARDKLSQKLLQKNCSEIESGGVCYHVC